MLDGDRPHKGKVAIYARVSTTDQTAENQLLDLRRYCASRGWTVVKEFVDVGVSGSKKDRPALDALMAFVKHRHCQRVLVWRFDRFARSVSHLVNSLELFRECGIEFTSYSESIDTGTSQGKLFFTFIAGIAEFERDLITERINSGIRRVAICRTCAHERHKDIVCRFCPCATYVSHKHLGRPAVPDDKIAAIVAFRGKLSIRQIAARVGLSKSAVQKVLSVNLMPSVASNADGDGDGK